MRTPSRLLAAAAVAAAATVIFAGPALADDGTTPAVTLTPAVNCIATSDQLVAAGYGQLVSGDTKDDQWAVLGYTNPSSTKVTVSGAQNSLAGVQGSVPTTFSPGTQFGQGVAALPAGASGTWTLTGKTVRISAAAAPACENDELPATGNGFGAPMVLLASIPVGIVATLVARKRRRTR